MPALIAACIGDEPPASFSTPVSAASRLPPPAPPSAYWVRRSAVPDSLSVTLPSARSAIVPARLCNDCCRCDVGESSVADSAAFDTDPVAFDADPVAFDAA